MSWKLELLRKNESKGVNSDTICKVVLEVGTTEMFLKE